MPGITSIYSFIHVWNEPIFWDYEYINWTTVESQLFGLYTFTGTGIVDGWDVLAVSEDEVANLPDSVKNTLIHTSYCMMFKVTAGDGVIGVYAAYTAEDTYISIPILPQSTIYYVYAIATECLPSKQKAEIYLTTDSTYDSIHRATYLSTVITYYDPDFGQTYIYRIYDENYRRRILKDLQGPALEAIREKFLRHRHIGQPDTQFQAALPDNPSKISLGSEDIENLTVVSSSTIFLIKNKFLLPKDLVNSGTGLPVGTGNAGLPKYEKADVKVNGTILGINDYYLDNVNGKLYLKNSVKSGDIVQIVKYQDPSLGQIARGPQDDPASSISGGNIPVVTGDARFTVDPRYKLPKNRVGDIDASKIVFGTLPISRIQPIDHYGMKRIRESAVVNPKTFTRTKDQTTYYLVPPENIILGYDTEILFSFNSKNLGNLVSTSRGLYKVTDTEYQTLTKIDFPDDTGRVIKIYDNNLEGDHDGGSQFVESYVLTDEGQVFYTEDVGLTWTQLQTPSDVFVNCFTVSTEKVETDIKSHLTHDYYKIYHIGTKHGLFSARFLAARGTLTGDVENIIITTIPWIFDSQDVEITALQEVITDHSSTSQGDTSHWYDRTLYIGTKNGFYIGNRLVANAGNIIAKDIMWVFNNVALMVLDSNKTYITHTFEHIQTQVGDFSEDYWKHPLSEVDEELHISYNFSPIRVNKLSQEFGRSKYFTGLSENIAVSSLDSQISGSLINMPFLHGSFSVHGNYGLNLLNAKLNLYGSSLGLNVLISKVKVLSLANVADQMTRTDAEKELADGWNPLNWNIPSTYMDNTRNVTFTDKTFVDYSSSYGSQQQPTNYYVASDNGIWKSVDGGSVWDRPVLIWDTDVIPYVERNGSEVLMAEYNLNHTLQAIVFKSQQKTSDSILIEKDFKEYFAVNGGWEQTNADLAVYINGELTTYPYVYDMSSGKFTFTDKLTKTTDITFSLVDVGTYITNIGITPHSEVLDAFIPSTTVVTALATDLKITDTTIKVLDTSEFPISPHYIQVENEKIYVKKIDGYTFTVVGQRNNAVAHASGKVVAWLEIKRKYGIDDYVSISTSGQTYNIFSVYMSNLLRGEMALKRVYEDIFDDVPHYPPTPSGSTVYEGLRQSLIHIDGIDPLDDASSISTLWSGLDIPSRTAVATPKIISYLLNPGTSSFIVGSDRGVWKFDGTKWSQLSDLDNASFVYYVVYDSRQGQSSNTFLIAGADNGLWNSSDNGVTWVKSTTLYEEQLGYMQGTLSWWSPSKKYEIYGKNDGLSMVVYGWDSGVPESFHSDHFDPVDGKKVYGFFQGVFYRINSETGQKTTYDSIWIMSEEGLYLCYNGTRYYSNGSVNPYSSILSGVEPIDPGYRSETTTSSTGETVTTVTSGTAGDLSIDQRYIKTGFDSSGQPIYEKLKFYGAFQDSRTNTVPLIFLTNDGLRISRNWRWSDPEDLQIYLSWEATPLSIDNSDILSNEDNDKRIVCNCFVTGVDNSILDTDVNVWRKYKCFIGTNKGVYRSYNGCYDLQPCEHIPGVSTIYSLGYYNSRLYAGTDNGWWFSDNDGDDWSVATLETSNVSYIDAATTYVEMRCLLTCDKTKVGSGGVVDFPALIIGSNMPSEFWTTVQSDGKDLRFTADDGTTVLNHELVSINTTTHSLEVWVKCPSLSSIVDVQIYAYWGDPSTVMPSPAFQQATWSNGFVSGWHMDGTSSPLSDMTSNVNSIDAYGTLPDEVPGQIGKAQDFNGSSDYFLSSNTLNPPAGAYTVSAWVNPFSGGGFMVNGADNGSGTFDRSLFVHWSGKYSFYVWNGSSLFAVSTTSLSNVWTYLVGTIDTITGSNIYVNGLIDGNEPLGTNGYNGYAGTARVSIGRDPSSWGLGYFNGSMDEVRYSSVTRSPEWILTEYNNQLDSSIFWSTGVVEYQGGSHTHDPNIDISVAQTFVPEYNEITKIGLYLHPKG